MVVIFCLPVPEGFRRVRGEKPVYWGETLYIRQKEGIGSVKWQEEVFSS